MVCFLFSKLQLIKKYYKNITNKKKLKVFTIKYSNVNLC